jgi:orotate phosphoribosyltransferase
MSQAFYGASPWVAAQLSKSPALQALHKRLFARLKALSFRQGQFILASGQSSNYYMDCRLTALDGEGSYLIGQLLGALTLACDTPIDAVGGMALGAAPLVTAVTCNLAAQGQSVQGILVRKEAKTYGGGKQIEGNLAPWMRLLLLEDVVTTGGSTQKAANVLKAQHPSLQLAGVFALVDRQAGGEATFRRLALPYHWLYSVQAFLAE